LPQKLYAVIEALQTLRGIAKISAVSIMAEVGELSRFVHARQLIGYSGAVSREHSSGERIRRGTINKAGNAHLRRIVIEAVRSERGHQGHGVAGAAPIARPLCEAVGQWQSEATGPENFLASSGPLASPPSARNPTRPGVRSRGRPEVTANTPLLR
jgi:hypothetical protein